ncbi:MAG: NADP-dependent malic enzyme [Alphaproteobacteria bacterium]|nr:NADP-dependent malic enzyme [Alphaproteobacteria bacterium]
MTRDIYELSLDYHRFPKPGKLEIKATKPLVEQHDLSLAYTPGVAAVSRLIAQKPEEAASLTARANLIAVVTNGTAVLGLGNIGPLAAKPVMEGKAVLFKKFAGIDVFDIEINETDPDKLVEIIASLEPTFGGINLEDIKAPECFYIEERLRDRLKIPVFHDDQHGTAIIVAAAILNGLLLCGKKIEDVNLVTSGAGAAAIACVDLLVKIGLNPKNIILCDSAGVVRKDREFIKGDPKFTYATNKDVATLAGALNGADIFLGVSVANVVTQPMIKEMAPKPLVLALANPEPEILPHLVRDVRPDAIIATGRSDFPNQVNNVLCFPFIFRGALDVGATTINDAMKIACVKAIAKLAQAESDEVVTRAYGGEVHSFGPDYIIPKPFDPRLILEVAYVVAEAAIQTGVATRPIKDMQAYRDQLMGYVHRSSMVMRPVISAARQAPKRVVFCEGEEEKILRAAQTLLDEGIAKPILVGRPAIMEKRIEKFGLRLRLGVDADIIDPASDTRFSHYWGHYHKKLMRQGVSPDLAKTVVRTNTTVIGALAVDLGDADALMCGIIGRYHDHLHHLRQILGSEEKQDTLAALSLMILERGNLFLTDPYVNNNPTSDEIVAMTLLAAEQVKRFGITPKVALLSHSNFGSSNRESALKMRRALEILRQRAPDLEIDGEMHADAALLPTLRSKIFPDNNLSGEANLLVMPNLDAANIAFNLTKVIGESLAVGPMLLGLSKPAHIITPSATARGIFNLTAIAVVEAGA